MAKYVIEIPENTHWIQWIMEGTKDHHPYMDWKLVEDLTPYTESDEQSVEKNAVNLCTSCKLFKEHFPECGDVNILFGDGVGNDNICCCNKYEPYTEPDEDESYGVNRYKAIGLAFLKWLERMDIFSMYFSGGDSDQPICMYELGRNILRIQNRFPKDWQQRIVISVEDGYRRKQDVVIQTSLATDLSMDIVKFGNYELATKNHAVCIIDAYTTLRDLKLW